MACIASYPGLCRHDLETELALPRARLVHEDYALVPLSRSHRIHPDRPLSHYIADDAALDSHYANQRRPSLRRLADDAVIDRAGPYAYSSTLPRCTSVMSPYDDAEYLDLPDPNWRFSYTYPLQCMEPGGVRWSPNQIHAYNRDVLRHNNQIARRRAAGVPGQYMMLHPMMDSLGRFPPGFDRPLSLQDFFGMDEPLLDMYRHHYGVPPPVNLERLLLLNSAEKQLRRQLKQIQLLELHGAKHLAEQFAVQLLAHQNALPGLVAPPSLGYGLGPDFDDSFLTPLMREYGGVVPLEAIGYGNGLANWNYDALWRLSPSRGGGGGLGLAPWSGHGVANPCARPSMYPGMGMNRRGHAYPGNMARLPYVGGAGGGGGPWTGPMMGGYNPRMMDMGGGQSDISRVIEAISCDGGGGGGTRQRRYD